jgi:DNA-binding response OmpR family regulator
VIRRNNRPAGPPGTGQEGELSVGPLRINPSAHVATLDDQPLKLTALEFDLLLCLARARGRVKTREQLINTVGERLYDSADRAIDVHVWSLRRKLGDDPKAPRFIRTVRAVGYMLINPETG